MVVGCLGFMYANVYDLQLRMFQPRFFHLPSLYNCFFLSFFDTMKIVFSLFLHIYIHTCMCVTLFMRVFIGGCHAHSHIYTRTYI